MDTFEFDDDDILKLSKIQVIKAFKVFKILFKLIFRYTKVNLQALLCAK